MKNHSSNNSELSDQTVIEQAYAATLDPERLQEFETFWEAYLDSEIKENESNSSSIDLPTVHRHIFRALEILERIKQDSGTIDKAQRIVDSNYGFGLIVNQTGHIFASNTDAEHLLNGAKSIYDIGLNDSGSVELQNWLQQDRRARKNLTIFLKVYLHNSEVPIYLFLTSVDLKLTQNSDQGSYFLVTSVEFDVDPYSIKAIENTFTLSKAEADIAFHLANGKSPTEIASARDTSILTVRTQIKNIIKKTNCRDLAHLIRLICNMSSRFAAVTSQVQRSEKSFAQFNFVRTGSITLRDLRFMHYFEQGHPTGRPVIHVHSLMNGPIQSAEFAKQATIRNWRVISPSRAGYGNSDALSKSEIFSCVDSTADDLAEIVKKLGLKKVFVMGSIHAQKFAFKYPELVEHFVCVNKVPAWHLDELEHLQPRQRNLIKTSLYAPPLTKFPIKLAKILVDTGRTLSFLRGLCGDCQIDLGVLENPDHTQIIVDGLRHSFQQGVDAFAVDVKGHHTDWIEDAKDLQVPISIITGSENSMQTEFGLKRYISAVPSARLVTIPNAGLFFPITHFDQIFDTLERLQSFSSATLTGS